MNRLATGVGVAAGATLGVAVTSSVGLGPATQITANCNQPGAHCQEPNLGQFPGGPILILEPTYDNFNAGGSVINTVCFYGAYIDPAGLADCDTATSLEDDISIRIWPSTAGRPPFPTPGPPVFSVNMTTATVTRRATGFEFALPAFPEQITEYEWTVDFTGQMAANTLTPGNCYWLRIENAVTSDNPNCAWYWEVSPEAVNDPVNGDGDDTSLDAELFQTCVQGGGNPVICAGQTDNPYDMAWCLDSDLGDVADDSDPSNDGCYLPIVTGCEEGVGTGACNTPNATPGCDDPQCCSLVCTPKALGGANLPFCCFSPWSQACADAAIDFGCTPVPPCQPEANCQLLSAANSFNSTVATDPADDQFVCADDFTPLADGAINDICWYGTYEFADPGAAPPDEFIVTYRTDDDGKPGAVLLDAMGNPASYNSVAGTLIYDENDEAHKRDSNLDLAASNDPIFVFFAQHEDVPVTAGTCYWIEITNKIGDPDKNMETSSWFWSWSETSDTAPFYSGNGRLAIDGAPPDGYDDLDIVAAMDLAFCLGLEVSKPTCGLQTLYNTGPEHPVLFDGSNSGNHEHFFLGYFSGRLCLDANGAGIPCGPDDQYPQRRSAHAFTLGPVPEGAGTDHRVRYIYVDGFEPQGGELNEDLSFHIFSRNGLTRPTADDLLVEGSMPFGAIIPLPNPEGGFRLEPNLYYLNVDFSLPPGDYWLSIWGSNSAEGPMSSNFAWYTNAHHGINNSCAPDPDCVGPAPEDDASAGVLGCAPRTGPPNPTADCNDTVGNPMMWRSRRFPDGAPDDPAPNDGFGFGSFSQGPNTLAWDPFRDPDGSPANLYTAAFQLRGSPGGTCGNGIPEPGEECDPPGPGCNEVCRIVEVDCPWDCDGSDDGNVNVSDILALLGQYDVGAPMNCSGGSCDYNGDGCIDVADLLKLLAHFDPGGIGCPQ